MARASRRKFSLMQVIIVVSLIAAGIAFFSKREAKQELSSQSSGTAAAGVLSDDTDRDVASPQSGSPKDRNHEHRLLLKNPVGIYDNSDTDAVGDIIRLAQKTVDIEIYEMNSPEVRLALREVMGRGVRVRVVKEPKPIGQTCDPFAEGLSVKQERKASPEAQEDCLDQQKLVREVRAHGGAFVPFNKAELCGQDKKTGNCYQHGKMILIDHDRFGLLSTGNFNSSNLCNLEYNPRTCNRDYTYITRDKNVLDALFTIFENDLKGRRYDLRSIVNQPGIKDRLTVSPFSLEPLTQFVRTAHKRIQIQNQYINPDSGLPDVLIEKAKEGVPIEIQLADVCTYGHVREAQAYQLYLMFAAMEQAGIKIRMFNKNHKIDGKPGYLHAKAIVVDNERAWVGSVNGSTSSLNRNREFGIFYTHPQRVQFLRQMLESDFENNASQTWRDSLRCRNVGYQSRDAAQANDSEYLDYVEQMKRKSHGSAGDDEPED